MTGVEFVSELPVDGRQAGFDSAATAAALRERPGEWACIRICEKQVTAATFARSIRRGTSAFGAGFEAVSRTIDGEHRVYARYVGVVPHLPVVRRGPR